MTTSARRPTPARAGAPTQAEGAARALVVTGTCGSGKTTATKLLALRPEWIRLSEDDVWRDRFGKNRGAFGSAEHRSKRQEVHSRIFVACRLAIEEGRRVAIDATVHESPPESYREYEEFFAARKIEWRLCVLHPRLEIAVARDAKRAEGLMGAKRVADLRAKFTGLVFPAECFVDTSDDTPGETVNRLLRACLPRPGTAPAHPE